VGFAARQLTAPIVRAASPAPWPPGHGLCRLWAEGLDFFAPSTRRRASASANGLQRGVEVARVRSAAAECD